MSQSAMRSEYKYLINTQYIPLIKARLGAVLRIDSHSGPEGYTIRSLYFDDMDFSSYHQKISGIKEREKFRLRYYNFDDSYVVFERKAKDTDLSKKTSARVSVEEAEAIIRGDRKTYEANGSPLLKIYSVLSEASLMRPAVIVDYDRIAYTYPIGNVRVTIDMNLRTAPYKYDFFDKKLMTMPVMEADEAILEIKFNGILPDFIKDIFYDIPLQREAISKYTRCLGVIE